jgi:hypothetical protein
LVREHVYVFLASGNVSERGEVRAI